MCVIARYEDKYPTKEMLDSMEAMNKDGGGIAWIEGDHVRWEKGMHVTSQFIMDKIESEKIQLPIIVHFRIATHGSVDTPLCHPFAISGDVDDTMASGFDKEGVLFHNGIWRDYKEVALKLLMNRPDAKLVDGDISDSRIMAWLVRYFGMNYLSMIDEKVCVLTPKGIQTFGKGWTTVDKVACSNSNFEKKSTYPSSWGSYYGRSQPNDSFQGNFRITQVSSQKKKDENKEENKNSKQKKIDVVEEAIEKEIAQKQLKSKATLEDYEDISSELTGNIPEEALEDYETWQEWCLRQEMIQEQNKQGDHNN